MIQSYQNAVLYSEIIAAVLGSIYYFKYKHTSFKYILLILWYIVFTETLGHESLNYKLGLYYEDSKGIKYNLALFNLLYLIIYPIFYYIYFKALNSKKFLISIKLFFILFIVTSIINWTFIQNFFTEYSKFPDIIGSLFLTICVIFYFIELLQSEKIIRFHKSVPFWISVGILIYYTSTIPFIVVQNTYALADTDLQKMFLINYILAIAMYILFSFGFVWSKKE